MRRDLDISSGGLTVGASVCGIGSTLRSVGPIRHCVVTARAVSVGDDIETFVCSACSDERNAVTGPCVAENEPIAAGNKKIPITQISVNNAVRSFR